VQLLDGAYDYTQVDSDPYARYNYMYAYDNNTYGLSGSVGTTFGWIWTHEQNAPPKNQVDWNNRRGRLKASGNTLTAILKAGTVGTGVECYFDNVVLAEVSDDYVVAAVANPTPGVQLTADLSALPPGQYPGEFRVTVYDAALNEASVFRNVSLEPVPLSPWVCADKETITKEVFVADTAAADTVQIWNCGQGGSLSYSITTSVPWIHVVPTDGTSPENPSSTNLHNVSFDHLAPGVHEGDITVTGTYNVYTIHVTITVTTVVADFDKDGDVDQADFGLFQSCYTTSAVQVSGACLPMDLNGDKYVNIADLPLFTACVTGSGVYPDPACQH
jgi:hypothetical protein